MPAALGDPRTREKRPLVNELHISELHDAQRTRIPVLIGMVSR